MNDIIGKINGLLKGKKTYLLGGAMITLAVLEALKVFTVPDWGWIILTGLGFGFLRAGVAKVTEALKNIPLAKIEE